MIRIIGAIFCHVNKIEQLNQFNPSITSGNQKWKGAAPNFINNAEFNMILNIGLIWLKINSLFISIKIIEINKIIEAIVCVIKYFIEDSDFIIFLDEFIKGIIEIKLISNPIHILIHEYEEIEIIVPNIIKLKKIIL